MLAPPRARRSEARRGGDQQEAVDTDSNARFGGEVEWNTSGAAIFGGAVSNSNGSTALLITD